MSIVDITEKANRIALAWESLAADNDMQAHRLDIVAEQAETDAAMVTASREAGHARDLRNTYTRCARAIRELVA